MSELSFFYHSSFINICVLFPVLSEERAEAEYCFYKKVYCYRSVSFSYVRDILAFSNDTDNTPNKIQSEILEPLLNS